jgi:hypothetical protein
MKKNLKIRFYVCSPNTDIPNKKYKSTIMNLYEILFNDERQIDFIKGGYLMLEEMEKEYTIIEIVKD